MNEDVIARLQAQLLRERAAREAAERSLDALVSQRREADQALMHERFLLQALMNHIPDHIYFKDRDSRLIRISQSQARLFGLDDPAAAVGKTDADFFSAEHAQQARRDELAVMESGQTLTTEEKETWPDRPDSWVSTRKVALRDDSGNVIGTFGISRDITGRRRIEAAMQAQVVELSALNAQLNAARNQLLQSEKMASIGQLAAGVAHEINNPVGFVNSNLGTLKIYLHDILRLLAAYEASEARLPEPERAPIAELKRAIDIDFVREDVTSLLSESIGGLQRVKRIVRDLGAFSHVGEDETQRANLEQGLDSTLNVVWNELKYKAEVVRDYAGIPEVECIPSQINQVFLNLLVNAAQAIDQHGTISLSSGREGGNVWVEVADTGSGIAPEHLARIFDPFFTTKPVGQGTGLGLSLSYGIVERHQGRIEVSSEVGVGTVFRVILPISAAGNSR